MPSGRTHIFAGLAAATIAVGTINGDVRWGLLGGLGGLIADTDTRKSILGRILPVWIFTKHRRFMHSYIALMIVTFVCWVYTDNVSATMAIGASYLSHLWLDWLTPMGIQAFWPHPKQHSIRRIFRRR